MCYFSLRRHSISLSCSLKQPNDVIFDRTSVSMWSRVGIIAVCTIWHIGNSSSISSLDPLQKKIKWEIMF